MYLIFMNTLSKLKGLGVNDVDILLVLRTLRREYPNNTLYIVFILYLPETFIREKMYVLSKNNTHINFILLSLFHHLKF